MSLGSRNRRVGLMALAGALAMLGLGYASAPLYRLFCEATGFGGTTRRASEVQASKVAITQKTISIRFDGNVESTMPWEFGPEQVTQTLRIGARKMAFFKAHNLSPRTITGIASFNVQPDAAGKYFNKVQCFCFNLQTLKSGQSVDMPVIYYVDPAILNDPETKGIEQITLSYTFHQVVDPAPKPLDPVKVAG